MQNFKYDNLTFNIFINENIDTLIYLHGNKEIGASLYDCINDKEKMGIIAIEGEDWNRDLSPWPADAVFKGGGSFDGKADDYLDRLCGQYIPDIEEKLGVTIKNRGIMGYSLAGLFAVYAVYNSDKFNLMASVSGSLWYDGFLEYIKANEMKSRLLAAYFSLGAKESNTKNERMARVEECTKEVLQWFTSNSIMVTYEVNPGNHFTDEIGRMKKAIEYLEDMIEKETNISRSEYARKKFREGYNCNQSVLLAFADLLDIDEKTLLRMGSALGGGMGRLREVCGAVSAMFIISGLLEGSELPSNTSEGQRLKTEEYKRIQEIARDFTDKKGSIICRELLGSKASQGGTPSERTAQYYQNRPCEDIVAMAVQILERKLK